MIDEDRPKWLDWAREIQALSQTGLAYSGTPYESVRYRRLMEIAAAIVHQHAGLPMGPLVALFGAQRGYATPKVDVRGAVVRERADGCWCMPGGWADVGEIPSAMVVREVQEESGFEVRPCKVVGVFDANRAGRPLDLYHAYKVVFLCDLVGREPRGSVETSGVGFFPFDNLPPLSLNRTNVRHLAEVQAHLQNPNRPAAFD